MAAEGGNAVTLPQMRQSLCRAIRPLPRAGRIVYDDDDAEGLSDTIVPRRAGFRRDSVGAESGERLLDPAELIDPSSETLVEVRLGGAFLCCDCCTIGRCRQAAESSAEEQASQF